MQPQQSKTARIAVEAASTCQAPRETRAAARLGPLDIQGLHPAAALICCCPLLLPSAAAPTCKNGRSREEPAAELGGRYWDRTSDLLGVNEALSR
jgi:hypothetical protein